MTAKATTAWPAAERTTRRRPPGRAARCARAQRAIIGRSRTAENLATHARPKTTALRAKQPAPGFSRWRHHAPDRGQEEERGAHVRGRVAPRARGKSG